VSAVKNPCGKLRAIERPYAVFRSEDGWEWRVLRKNEAPDREARNPFASWFCATKSPFTFGRYECGDVYVSSIREGGGVDVTAEALAAEALAGPE
jgi:hypothetical protein